MIKNVVLICCYFSREGSKSLSWKYCIGQKNGLHAFGYNSAESEAIWMKSGTVWAKCLGLALADFERHPRSSDSLRGREILFFWWGKFRTISLISHQTNVMTFEQKTSVGVAM